MTIIFTNSTNLPFGEMVEKVDIVGNDVNIFGFCFDQLTNPVNLVVDDGIQNMPSLIDFFYFLLSFISFGSFYWSVY
uniref:MATA-HMG n=1 Tax=Rhizophagus irregularis TaxID=588596 RepID=A0A1B1EWE8_9GLOM|nr:MATA-HMG [Rhizophagus irregularis]